LNFGASPANIAKTNGKCTRFYQVFSPGTSKNPQIPQIQQENITNPAVFPEESGVF
jgi:hypothetical protein